MNLKIENFSHTIHNDLLKKNVLEIFENSLKMYFVGGKLLLHRKMSWKSDKRVW